MIREAPTDMLSLDRLSLSVGAFALNHVSLSLPTGGYGVLLGPTGCGKTLLAETICGLMQPSSGRIFIGGRDVTDLDPACRNIGYVPQDYALLPFRSVARNIAFGLEARRLPSAEIERRVERMLDLLGLQALRDRVPRGLSGGERQRTALGRALAIEPDLLVLDEPLSAVDEATGDALIERMGQWHRQLKTTTLHICHRLEEALRLGTLLAIMRDGNLIQAASPDILATQPANAFVADFMRRPNRLPGEVMATAAGSRFFAGSIPLTATDCPVGPALGLFPLNKVTVTVSPTPAQPASGQCLPMTIEANTFYHSQPALHLQGAFSMRLPGIYPLADWPVGHQVYVWIPEQGWTVLPRRSDLQEGSEQDD